MKEQPNSVPTRLRKRKEAVHQWAAFTLSDRGEVFIQGGAVIWLKAIEYSDDSPDLLRQSAVISPDVSRKPAVRLVCARLREVYAKYEQVLEERQRALTGGRGVRPSTAEQTRIRERAESRLAPMRAKMQGLRSQGTRKLEKICVTANRSEYRRGLKVQRAIKRTLTALSSNEKYRQLDRYMDNVLGVYRLWFQGRGRSIPGADRRSNEGVIVAPVKYTQEMFAEVENRRRELTQSAALDEVCRLYGIESREGFEKQYRKRHLNKRLKQKEL
jgi:hypothetical protein